MTIANKLVFQRALDQLQVTPDRVLIDGILALDTEELTKRNIQEQHTFVEGDGTYLPIAAASIIAKHARDTYVEDCVEENPDLELHYSIGSSKGYGTEKHRKGILAHGKHNQHRDLFLRKLLGKTSSSECLITDT